MTPSPNRLVRTSVVLTLLGLCCFCALLLFSAYAERQRMLFIALLTLGGFSLTGSGILGFFLLAVRHFTKTNSPENPDN